MNAWLWPVDIPCSVSSMSTATITRWPKKRSGSRSSCSVRKAGWIGSPKLTLSMRSSLIRVETAGRRAGTGSRRPSWHWAASLAKVKQPGNCPRKASLSAMSSPVYALNLFDVSDRQEYLAYSRRSAAEVERHGGRVVALGRFRENLLGGVEPRQVMILVEWSSRDAFEGTSATRLWLTCIPTVSGAPGAKSGSSSTG